MEELVEQVRAYLADLEADRKAALALSEQKAEEAKLIQVQAGRISSGAGIVQRAKLLRVNPVRERKRRDPLVAAMCGIRGPGNASAARTPVDPRLIRGPFRPATTADPDRQGHRLHSRTNRNGIGAHGARRPGSSWCNGSLDNQPSQAGLKPMGTPSARATENSARRPSAQLHSDEAVPFSGYAGVVPASTGGGYRPHVLRDLIGKPL